MILNTYAGFEQQQGPEDFGVHEQLEALALCPGRPPEGTPARHREVLRVRDPSAHVHRGIIMFGVTILIPTFNRAKFSKLIVHNINCQTYPCIEKIIVADDGDELLDLSGCRASTCSTWAAAAAGTATWPRPWWGRGAR